MLHYEVSAQRVGNLYQVEEDVTYPTKKYTIDIDDPAIANLILNKQIDLHLKIVFGVALDLTVKHSGSEDSETFSRGLLEFEDASPNVAILTASTYRLPRSSRRSPSPGWTRTFTGTTCSRTRT